MAEKTKHIDEKSTGAKVSKNKKAPKEKKPTDKLADKSGLTIFLQHIFGDAQKKTLRRLQKRVDEINKLAPKYSEMSKKELQEQTEVLKKKLNKAQKKVEAANAVAKVKNEKSKKSTKGNKKDNKIAKKQAKIAEANKALDQILPEAFALVREASDRVLKLRPFDVQLIGGMVLHEGNVAEQNGS